MRLGLKQRFTWSGARYFAARSLAGAGLVACWGLVACGGPNPAEDPHGINCPAGQHYDGQYCVHDAASSGGAGGGGQAGAGTGAAGTGAAGTGGLGAGAAGSLYQPGPTAKALEPPVLLAAEPVFAELMAKHAAGARSAATWGGQFTQGQVLEHTFQAQTGRCYTLIGVGTEGISDLDLKLVTEAAIPGVGAAVLATDQTHESRAVVAAQPDCYKWVLPSAPLKVVLSVAGGQGMAVARLLER